MNCSRRPSAPRAALLLLALPPLATATATATAQEPSPLAWETLDERLASEAAAGFSGVALVVHDGEVVLRAGFGLANRETKTPCTPETVFAIGSTPIDFTKAGILLLVEDGKLRLDETLPAFFEDVPEDKRAITVEHLMTGRSGLRDFHDLPVDRDPDHSWVDREEAVLRILDQELLFAPGRGEQHSHSAWGLLAAILELRSGKSYPEFTRARLFAPAGMADTAFNGDEVDPERLAIGYGVRSDGKINAPPYWGPTSWLVMGSGGMVSTAEDMLRWNRALRAGRILSAESLARYWSPPGGVLAGGDMYGFEIVYTEGPGSLMLLLSNAVDASNRDAFQRLALDLADLVNAALAPPFEIGIQMELEDGRVLVSAVVPGGAADAGGLRAGDILLAIDDRPLARDPRAVLDPFLESGEEILFEFERGGERMRVTVKPRAR